MIKKNLTTGIKELYFVYLYFFKCFIYRGNKVGFMNFKYLKPSKFLPIIGFQMLETVEDSKCNKISDPNGFCAVWCVWWAEQKIINYDIESNKLAEELIKHMKFSNKSFKKLIRNYSINIVKLRDEYLHKYNINIDDWMVGNYDEEIINNIEKNILEKIN